MTIVFFLLILFVFLVLLFVCFSFFFFFQAEDGIRDRDVTGVQTCALPIFELYPWACCTSCWMAALPSLPGLPEGMRTSTICLSANRLKDPPAASTSLQSKCAPCTVCTARSV